MSGNKNYIIGVIILVCLVIIIFSIVPSKEPVPSTTTNTNGGGGGSSAMDMFAKCLTEKGVKMYGASWCSHCSNQKKAFGESFQYVDYVECTEREAECLAAGIEGYPTWVINGNKYPGEQSFANLAGASGCTY